METMEQEAENRKYWDQLTRVRGVMQRMFDQQSEPSEMPVKESMQRTLRKRLGEVFVSMKQLRGLAVPIGKHQPAAVVPGLETFTTIPAGVSEPGFNTTQI